jgi:hypothetical protein
MTIPLTLPSSPRSWSRPSPDTGPGAAKRRASTCRPEGGRARRRHSRGSTDFALCRPARTTPDSRRRCFAPSECPGRDPAHRSLIPRCQTEQERPWRFSGRARGQCRPGKREAERFPQPRRRHRPPGCGQVVDTGQAHARCGASRGRALSQRSGQRGPVSSTRQRGPFRNIGPSNFTNPCPGPFVIQ